MSAETSQAATAEPAETNASKGVVCNCRARIEAKLTKRFIENAPEATGHTVELQGYGFAIAANSLVMPGFMPYEAEADYPLKKGGTKTKKLKGKMLFSFCPFCGKAAA